VSHVSLDAFDAHAAHVSHVAPVLLCTTLYLPIAATLIPHFYRGRESNSTKPQHITASDDDDDYIDE
jgi:hypothetical protein